MGEHRHLWVEYRWLERCLTCLILKRRDTNNPEKCHDPGCGGYAMFLNDMKKEFWCKTHNPSLLSPKEVKTRFGQVVTVPVGKDWCVECGHLDDPEEFLRAGQCPNPDCPRPWKWE